MDLTTVCLFIGLISIVVVASKVYLEQSKKKETEELLKDTFIAQSRGMEESSGLNQQFQEDNDQVLGFIDDRIGDKFPLLGKKLVQSGSKISALRWVIQVVLISVLVPVVLFVFLLQKVGISGAVLISLVAFLAVPGISLISLEMSKDKRIQTFDEQLGVGLDVMSSAIKSGSTFTTSIKSIAEDSDPPFGNEMGIFGTELGLGVDLGTALNRFRERVPSKNLLVFAIAIKIADQTGAALAPILNTLSKVIIERFKLQGKIKTGVSENIIGIIILGSFPWIVIPMLAFSMPEAYLDFFDFKLGNLPVGKAITFACFCWYAFGIYCMYKTVKAIDA